MGGDANVMETLAALTKELYRFGTRYEFLRPAFGMAETCAAAIDGKDSPSCTLKPSLEFSPMHLHPRCQDAHHKIERQARRGQN